MADGITACVVVIVVGIALVAIYTSIFILIEKLSNRE